MIKHMSSTAGGKEEEATKPRSEEKGPKKPAPFRVNTLRMMELPQEDIAILVKLGFSDIIQKIGVQKHKKVDLQTLKLDLERQDELTANQISFKFLSFKPLTTDSPRRLQFIIKFFSFPDIQTECVSLVSYSGAPADEIKPNQTYYTTKDRFTNTVNGYELEKHQYAGGIKDSEFITTIYEVDPSESHIADEHVQLAQYLRARYMTIELHDADTRFHFATAKIPLFELLRQKRVEVTRGRRVEVCKPNDSGQIRGTL